MHHLKWPLNPDLSMAITNAVIGILFCITVIGIPFGKQYFKLAKQSLMPFGAEVRNMKKD